MDVMGPKKKSPDKVNPCSPEMQQKGELKV
jgi:hypothetical protein